MPAWLLLAPDALAQCEASAKGRGWIEAKIVPSDRTTVVIDHDCQPRPGSGAIFLQQQNVELRMISLPDGIWHRCFASVDLCQEVFLSLFQSARLFDATKGRALSWIIQITYSRALSRRKYLAHRRHYDAEELNEEQIEAGGNQELIDDIAAKTLLSRFQGHLTKEQRYTIELHFFEGYSLREIAEKTDETLGNTRHHFYRGLKRLRSGALHKRSPSVPNRARGWLKC
jgi:RNA polymerase sigma factor (sigma-70 family)